MWQLSIASSTWVEIRTSGVGPSGRAYHTATLLADSTSVLVFGGRNTKTIHKSNGYVLDLETSEWKEVGRSAAHAPRLGRSSHSAVLVGERVLIFGGKQAPLPSSSADADGRMYALATSSLLVFDGKAQQWAPLPADDGRTSRSAFGAASSCEPRLP